MRWLSRGLAGSKIMKSGRMAVIGTKNQLQGRVYCGFLAETSFPLIHFHKSADMGVFMESSHELPAAVSHHQIC